MAALQQAGRELVDGAIRILERFPDLSPDTDWPRRVRIAMQMILGTLNNAIINRPGPLELTDESTSHELSQAAVRCLRWDGLTQAKSAETMLADVPIKASMLRIGRKKPDRRRT